MIKRICLIAAVVAGLACSVSCGVLDHRTAARQVVEIVNERYTTKGTYIGNASSYSEAQELTRSRGYTHFNWYQGTGDVYGYNQ